MGETVSTENVESKSFALDRKRILEILKQNNIQVV